MGWLLPFLGAAGAGAAALGMIGAISDRGPHTPAAWLLVLLVGVIVLAAVIAAIVRPPSRL